MHLQRGITTLIAWLGQLALTTAQDVPTLPEDWGRVVGPWHQCGGQGYTGLTECVRNWTCVDVTAFDARCLPWVFVTNETVLGTVRPAPTPAPTPNVSISNSISNSNATLPSLANGWQQCGGRNFFPASTPPDFQLPCESGFVCNRFTDWYFQCVPAAIVGFWSQCGGDASYTGPTQCVDGASCHVLDAKYSQCLPD